MLIASAASTAIVISLTLAILRHYHQRKRLGNFPNSSPWFLPLDLLHVIRAGTLERCLTNRREALMADAFYFHLVGLTKRPTLVLFSPEDHMELIKKESKLKFVVDMPDTVNETHGPGNLQMVSGKRHNFLRKIFASLLSPAALESFTPYFFDAFTKMWKKLEEECASNKGSDVIIQDAICSTQFFLMARILFGMTPENTPMEMLLKMREDFETQLEGHFATPKSDTFKKAKAAGSRIRDILSKKFNAVLETRRQIVQARKEGEETNDNDDGKDNHKVTVGNAMESIADALVKDGVDTDPQVLSDVYSNLNLLLEASHGTTMTVTTSALYYLNHPDNADKLQKLRKEMKAFGTMLPTLANLKNDMPIAEGVIKETMRLAPITFGVTYAVKDDIEFTFKGQQMQGPISFLLTSSQNYVDADIFPNPDAFIPERWIPGSRDEASERAHLAYRPFGMGRHMCLGYNLAILVMKGSLYCFARDETRAIEFDVDKVSRKAEPIFPAFRISDGLPGRVTKNK